MAILLGNKDTFAAEVGDADGTDLRRVDLWAVGQWLTCDDNTVYVPQFRHYVGLTRDRVVAEAVPSPGPSAVAAHRRLLADGERLLPQFWREDHLRAHPEHAETVFTAKMPVSSLTGILHDLVVVLSTEQDQQCR